MFHVLADDPRRNGTAAQPIQQQQQPVPHDLQALLQNPQLLSAAITGSIAGGATSAAASLAPQSGAMLQIPVGGADVGMQLQLNSGPASGSYTAAAGDNGMYSAAVGSWDADGAAVGIHSMGGQMQMGGFGGLAAAAALSQQPLGFADEADDPYDPEHPD